MADNNGLPQDPTITAPPTDVVETAPVVEQPPVQEQQQEQPVKQKEKALPTQSMGDLPQWTTILKDNKYREADSGQQNKYREKWLGTISELNPNMSKEQKRDLRSKIYTMEHKDFDPGSWNKTHVEGMLDKPMEATKEKFGMDFTAVPETALPSNIEGGGKVMKKIIPSERIGVTKFEKYIAKVAKGQGKALSKNIRTATGQDPVLKNKPLYNKMITGLADASGLGPVLRNIPNGEQILGALGTVQDGINRAVFGQDPKKTFEEGMSLIDQALATMDWVTGGMKGEIEKEKRRARADGRHQYYRALPVNSRHKKIKEVIENPDGYSGFDLQVADLIPDLLKKGLDVEQIDKVLFAGMASKQLPDVGFYYGMGKNLAGWKALKNPMAVVAQGLAGVPGFDIDSANEAFWKGVQRDDEKREHIFPSDIRKELKGKTFEESYGLIKGTLMNMGLSLLADPLLWADLGSTRVKQVTKAAFRMMTGEASMKQTKHTVETLMRALKTNKNRIKYKSLIDDMLHYINDPLFQKSIRDMDAASSLATKRPDGRVLNILTEGTAGTKLPAMINERFGKVGRGLIKTAEDIMADPNFKASIKKMGEKAEQGIDDVKALPAGRGGQGVAYPMKGEVPQNILGDVERAIKGEATLPSTSPRQLELAPSRAVGEITEGGLPKISKEGTQVVDEVMPPLETLPETIARRDQELKAMGEVGEVPANVSDAMDEVRRVSNEARIRDLEGVSKGVEGAGTYLRGTDVTDYSTDALEAFRAGGGQVKRIPEGVGQVLDEFGEEFVLQTGDVEKGLMQGSYTGKSERALTQGGRDLSAELQPVGFGVRRGAKYRGEVKDTVAGAFEQYTKIKTRGSVTNTSRKLTKPEMSELDGTIKKLSKEWDAYQEAANKSKGVPLTKLEKSLQALDENVERLQRSTRPTVVWRRTSEPGVSKMYKKIGDHWVLKGEWVENPNGEYLGSIFGQAQKFFDERAARKLLGKTTQGEFDDLNSALKKSYVSIEKQFENFPIVGKAVKNMYSIKDAVQERGLKLMKEISGQSLTRRWSKLLTEDMIDVPLIYEDRKLWDALSRAEQERLQPTLIKLQEFLREFKKGYKDLGIDVNFKDHIREKWIADNRAIQDTMGFIKDGTKKYVGKRDLASLGIQATDDGFNPRDMKAIKKILADNFFQNEKMVSEIKNFEYMPIPYGQWFESGYDKAAAIKAMSIANAQGRKTFRIADLIESGAIQREQVNLIEMLAAYTQRASKDFAMLEVKNAMQKSGLILDMTKFADKAKGALREAIGVAKQKGWRKPDVRHFPMYSKTMMHPAMLEWLHHFKYERLNANKFDKVMSAVKVWQFANPFFLPYYDMMQGIVARGPLGAMNPIGIGRDMAWAIKTMKNRPREYWDLMHAGLQSKPMAMPFSQWQSEISKLKNTNAGGYIWQLTKETVGTAGLRPIYEASWNTAWGLDKLIRLSTAKNMMRKGMSTFDAAQFSALIHSDYANVPMSFRRNFNRVFFTPTFKITMFRLYKEMMKNMLKVPLKYVTGKGAEVTLKEKQLAKAGMTTVLGAMVGMDMFMRSKGYQRDQFARRYYKEVTDAKGQTQEDVVVFASPLNMAPKYAYKLRDLAKENYKDNKFQQFTQSFKWELHPIWRILAIDVAGNKKDNGDKIWEPFGDSDPMKYAKIAEYVATSSLAIIKQIGLKDEPADQQEAWNLYRKDIGQVFSTLSAPTTFAYLRDPKVQRYRKKLERTRRDWKRAMSDAQKEGKWNRNMAINGQKKLIAATQDLKRAIKQAEKINDQSTWSKWKREQNKRAQ